MPGRSNSDNKFGFSSYVVGTTLGDGCNYNTIQSAIDDVFAVGGGVVLIRPGTYTENLVFRTGVDLFGASVDGRLPFGLSQIDIIGNHTFSGSIALDLVLITNINFQTLAGDAFTLSETNVGSQLIFAMQDCGIDATTDPTSRCVVLNPDLGASIQFSTDNCQINCANHIFENIGAGSGTANLQFGNANSSTGNAFELSSGSGSFSGGYTNVSVGQSIMRFGTASGSSEFEHSGLSSTDECFLYSVASGGTTLVHCDVSSVAASGNFIDGVGGSLSFVDISLNGSALGIGGAITQQKLNWQPYGEAAVAALGSNRGTASFNSNDFVLSDGFVSLIGSVSGPVTQLDGDTGSSTPAAGVIQIAGGPGVTTSAAGSVVTVNSVVWTDVAGPTLAAVDNGYFDLAGTTITLPGAPAQGEQIRVISVSTPTVIQAVGAQTITVGNVTSSPAGTATSTDTGDCLVLIYNAALDRFIAESVLGNWSLA